MDPKGTVWLAAAVKSYAIRQVAERRAARAETPEERVATAIVEILRKAGSEEGWVTMPALLARVNDDGGEPEDEKSIGRALRALGINQSRRRLDPTGDRKVRQYLASRSKLRASVLPENDEPETDAARPETDSRDLKTGGGSIEPVPRTEPTERTQL